jgi:hypothetical protein
MVASAADVETAVLGAAEVAGLAVAEDVDAGRLVEAAEAGAGDVSAGADEGAAVAVPVRVVADPETAELPHALIRAAINKAAAPDVDLFMIRTSAEYPGHPGRARWRTGVPTGVSVFFANALQPARRPRRLFP